MTSDLTPYRVIRLDALTSLRFFAAAWVFFDHFGKNVFSDAPEIVTHVLPHGRLAVSFFFVLSGFVLVYSNTNDGSLIKTKTQFLWARVARIYPVYFFALLIPLPYKLWGLYSSRIGGDEFAAVPLVLTLTQSWVPSLAASWNPPAWSLSVEAFFYLCFPWVVGITKSFSSKTLLIVAIMFVILSEITRNHLLTVAPNWGAFFPLLHFSLFFYGIALGRFFQTSCFEAKSGRVLFAGAGIVVYGTTYFYGIQPYLLPIISLSLGVLVIAAAWLRPGAFRVLQHPWMVLLGNGSYAFYITHMPVMIAWQRSLLIIAPGIRPMTTAWVFWTGLIICIVVSVVTHLVIERRARAWLLRFRATDAHLTRPVVGER